jgi:23S rRNA (adenine2503-C2)-methyltransferase
VRSKPTGTSRQKGKRPRSTNPTTRKPTARETRVQTSGSRSTSELSAHDLLATYRPDLSQILVELEAPAYRYDQVCEHLFKRPALPISRSTVLPAATRDALEERGASCLTVSASRTAKDRTTKLLLTAADGASFEMVIMRYRQRNTACISSQVGCPVGCAFCATGRSGFERNLSTAEIVDQARIACAVLGEEGARLSNIVYMGMGEPLLNMQAVLNSIAIITSPRGLRIGHRSISVSTVGIPAGIRRLARAEPQVNLALSLHASDERTRASLIPDTHRHPLSKILEAAWDHFDTAHRKILVEYVLLDRINDSTTDARRLAALLRGHVVTVNLLTWNPVSSSGEISDTRGRGPSPPSSRLTTFRPSNAAAVAAFRNSLVAAGVEAVVRQSRGDSIDAACGQLAGQSRHGSSSGPSPSPSSQPKRT